MNTSDPNQQLAELAKHPNRIEDVNRAEVPNLMGALEALRLRLQAHFDGRPVPVSSRTTGETQPPQRGDGAGTYLNTAQAGNRLSVEPETIASWCRDGRFPNAFKTDPSGENGEWRIPVEDVRSMRQTESEPGGRVHFNRN